MCIDGHPAGKDGRFSGVEMREILSEQWPFGRISRTKALRQKGGGMGNSDI